MLVIMAKARIELVMTPEMRTAIDSYCHEHNLERSEFIRECVLKKIGRADLIATMPPRGRPWPKK